MAILKLYFSTKLSIACNKSQQIRTDPTLPPGVAAPQMVLAADALSLEDIQFVSTTCLYTEFPSSLENLEKWNFDIYFSRPGKCLEFAQKVGKIWNFSWKPGKNSRFTFQDVIYKTKSDLHLCFINIININTISKSNWSRISLLLPGK